MSVPYDDDDVFSHGLAGDLLGAYASPAATGLASTLTQKPQPPSTQPAATPVTGFIQVSKYKGEDGNLFGHVGLSVNGGPSFGLDPAFDLPGSFTDFGPRAGIVDLVAPGRKIDDQIRIPVSADQAETVRQYLLKNAGPTTYDLENRNCSTFAADALRAAGLKVPQGTGDLFPGVLFQTLHQIYDRPAAPAPKLKEFAVPVQPN